jgi:predicted ester cyclase
MSMKSLSHAWAVPVLASMLFAASATGSAEDVRIDEIVTCDHTPQRPAVAAAVRAFYAFWNTGDESFLKDAIAESFTDHTLPPGRPQGPGGPPFASRAFRAAVPDLRVEVRMMVVAGEYVTVHMLFTGHFTGAFGSTRGAGQRISFIATDLLKVHDGRISDNWHLEDNLALLKQMGLVNP